MWVVTVISYVDIRLRWNSHFLGLDGMYIQIPAVRRYCIIDSSVRSRVLVIVAATAPKLQHEIPAPLTQTTNVTVEDLKWSPVFFVHKLRRLDVQ